MVFEQLDAIDLLACIKVCKNWHGIIMARPDSVQKFWTDISIRNKSISNEVN